MSPSSLWDLSQVLTPMTEVKNSLQGCNNILNDKTGTQEAPDRAPSFVKRLEMSAEIKTSEVDSSKNPKEEYNSSE